MVKRRELPCHLEWLVEGGVDGSRQPDPVGDAGQRGQHGERVRTTHHVEVVDVPAALPQPKPLGEKEEVEQSAFRGAGEVHERVEIDLAARARVRPHRGVIDTREMGCQVNQLAVLAFPDIHAFSPQRLAINSCERSRSTFR